ncbi:MAG TPA: DeoR family transcriptional regulator [Candidatus Paceibacterota bacterium]|nr:DeoR family transcriptional regulator [Candidatus Paceibacterota bacterium]
MKSEKIAHVLTLLLQGSPAKDKELLQELVASAGRLPHMITHFVAGEVEAALVLADIFSVLSLVRLSATQGYIRPENTRILAAEYEDMVRRIAAENHPSPFITAQDFTVEEAVGRIQLGGPVSPFSEPASATRHQAPIKDKSKGHIKGNAGESKGQQERAAQIYDFVKSHKGVSIKEIAAVVRGCSEKTIQRELAGLIRQGLIQRKGEKRWSIYVPIPSF